MTTRPVLSTYRLQLRRELDFAAAAELVDYLAELGVSHLYASPILQATAGSSHGYDVVDPTRISADLGGPDGFDALVERLHAAGLGVIVDIVPNHMGVEIPKQNAWWWDVLKNGRASAYAHYFDIDWTRPRIALPILGEAPGELEKLQVDGDELVYAEHRLPIAEGTGEGSPTDVHDRQHYQLVPWNAGEVGYRRFFMVNTLAAVRQEDPEVFEACHRQLLPRVARGQIDGLRVDHPDGMAAPVDYLRRLSQNIPSSWLVIEKILAPDEELDPGLPVAGTTGYEVMRLIDGVFVDPAGEPALTALAHRLTGDSFDDAEHDLKLETGSTGLRPELRRIARLIGEVPGGLDACISALAELAACVPVYRADYSTTAGLLTQSLAEANHRAPHLEPVLSTIGARLSEGGEAAARFHQVCGAITAKSIEDQLFYRTTRLTALNEVGGDPRRFAVTPGEFHLHLARQAREWPGAMTTLSTHDTKRAVDVRARIAVLAEIPDEWARAVDDWSTEAAPPEPSIGYLLWQTLVGCWPVGEQDGPDAGRMHAYAEKACREAGVMTSWNAANADFERQLHSWLDTVLSGPVGARIAAFAEKLAPNGWSNSLGATLLQLAGPGVPDTYAGCELWDYSLVDPDNRRPVDFGLRRELLLKLTDHIRPPAVDSSGAAKLWLLSRALRTRKERSDVFVGGGYTALLAHGPASFHAVSYCRHDTFGVPAAIAVATRLPAGLDRTGGWRGTGIDLPAGAWTDALTGTVHQGSVPVFGLLDRLPVALLTRS